jgi:hypothetical protein
MTSNFWVLFSVILGFSGFWTQTPSQIVTTSSSCHNYFLRKKSWTQSFVSCFNS